MTEETSCEQVKATTQQSECTHEKKSSPASCAPYNLRRDFATSTTAAPVHCHILSCGGPHQTSPVSSHLHAPPLSVPPLDLNKEPTNFKALRSIGSKSRSNQRRERKARHISELARVRITSGLPEWAALHRSVGDLTPEIEKI